MKILVPILGVILITSCGMLSPMTEKERELNYKIDKLYLEYSYKRDSLLIEYYRTPVIEEDGVRWFTRDTVITIIKE